MPADNNFLQLTSTLKSLYHSDVNSWSEMTSVGNKRTHNPSVPGSSPGCPKAKFIWRLNNTLNQLISLYQKYYVN